ncbi:MAG: YceI family protein [Aestuariibaculum sp.]
MKTRSIITIMLLMPWLILAQTWKNDPTHSRMGFEVSHLTISDVSGIFKTFEVTITSGKEDFSDAKISVVVDLNSIDTEVEPRDNHLKSPDFFEVKTYPKITFTSTSVKAVDKNTYKITGTLNLHGITLNHSFTMEYNGTIANDKGTTAGFKVTGSLLRSDYGIGNKFPINVIGDKVNIVVDLEMKKQ